MKRYIKSNENPLFSDDAFDYIAISEDAYIQDWQKQYDGEPATSWHNIFDNALFDFKLYADDEASADENGMTIQDKFDKGIYSALDVEFEFDNWLMWIDIEDYDVAE